MAEERDEEQLIVGASSRLARWSGGTWLGDRHRFLGRGGFSFPRGRAGHTIASVSTAPILSFSRRPLYAAVLANRRPLRCRPDRRGALDSGPRGPQWPVAGIPSPLRFSTAVLPVLTPSTARAACACDVSRRASVSGGAVNVALAVLIVAAALVALGATVIGTRGPKKPRRRPRATATRKKAKPAGPERDAGRGPRRARDDGARLAPGQVRGVPRDLRA